MLISLSDLPEALRKRVTTLRECVNLALADFVKLHTGLRARYSARSEASIIHDYMVAFAKDRFPWRLKRNLFLIEIEGFRAKLKKLDGGWRPRNVQTQLVINFERQQPLRLFDDLDVEHVFLGYQRDEVETLKSKVWLVCPDGKGFKWIAELTESEGVGSVQVAATSPVEGPAEAARRIRPKKVAEAEGEAKVSIKE